MNKWEKLADVKTIEKTKKSLEESGIQTIVVNNSGEAKSKVLELIPKGAEVMTMSSVTLAETGIADEINNSKDLLSVRKKLMSMDRAKQGIEMQKLGAAPQYVIGSPHAVTEDGKIVIASNTGSQLPAYAYGSENAVFVVGTQKIVKDLDQAFKRIYEHCLPLEDARALKAYGMHSGVNKMLIINKEIRKDRITIIFVKEKLGF